MDDHVYAVGCLAVQLYGKCNSFHDRANVCIEHPCRVQCHFRHGRVLQYLPGHQRIPCAKSARDGPDAAAYGHANPSANCNSRPGDAHCNTHCNTHPNGNAWTGYTNRDSKSNAYSNAEPYAYSNSGPGHAHRNPDLDANTHRNSGPGHAHCDAKSNAYASTMGLCVSSNGCNKRSV